MQTNLEHKVYEQLSKTFYEVYFTSKRLSRKNKYFIKNINILNTQKILNVIKKIKPKYVINCTGVIKQKLKNKRNKNLFLINTKFPITLDRNSKILKYNHIHFSTDCVFDGMKGNYGEMNKPNAKDEYGISKLKSENIVKKNSLVIRTSIIGHEKIKKKFIKLVSQSK